MTKKIFLALAALTALTLCFSSCKEDNKGGGDKPKPKTEVKLKVEPKEVKVMVGNTEQLTVTVEPADTKYTFESANAEIATVTDKGLVTGVKAGNTVITVKAGDATKTAKVEVIDAGNTDTNSGIGVVDKDIPHFIYIPADKAKIKKENLEIFKTIMTAAGWEWDQETFDFKNNKDKLFPFLSPMVKTKDGQAPKYFYNGVEYMYKTTSGDPVINFPYYYVSREDPLAESNRKAAEEEGIVALWKTLYGFNVQDSYREIQGMNAWIGFNTTAIEGVPLQVIIASYKLTKDDVGKQTEFIGYYQIITQVAYAQTKGQTAQISSLPVKELRNISLNTPLRSINR